MHFTICYYSPRLIRTIKEKEKYVIECIGSGWRRKMKPSVF